LRFELLTILSALLENKQQATRCKIVV